MQNAARCQSRIIKVIHALAWATAALLMALWGGVVSFAQPATGPDRVMGSEPLQGRVADWIASLSATDALRLMKAGRLTSELYVSTLLRRIDANSELNAVIAIDPAGALAAARAADAMRAVGAPLGELHGLPILVKDSIDTKHLPTTNGTPALAGFRPREDAAVVRAMLAAGAIVLGKSNLHELQAGFTTQNPFTGIARNPYDSTRSPGGSSGGNGAALAARLAPLALGVDTGGSVRVPAALNGVTGFRPTSGRYSQEGIVPLSPTLDSVGLMARRVRDLALADSVLASAAVELERVELRGLRIGVPRRYFHDLLDPSVKAAVERTLRRLRLAGVELVSADIPEVGELTMQASLAITFFEALPALAEYLSTNETGVSLTELASKVASPDVQLLLAQAAANPIAEEDYLAVLSGLRPLLSTIYANYFASHDLDAVIYPTSAALAPPIGAESVSIGGVELPVFGAFFRLGHYTPVLGAPTLTLPIGQRPDGLPAGGIDLAGLPGDDRRILAIGAAIEQILPGILPPRDVEPGR